MISGGNVCVCDPGVSMVQKAPAKAAVLLRDGLDYAFVKQERWGSIMDVETLSLFVAFRYHAIELKGQFNILKRK